MNTVRLHRTIRNLADRETLPALLDILICQRPLRLCWEAFRLCILMAGLDDWEIRIATTQFNYIYQQALHEGEVEEDE